MTIAVHTIATPELSASAFYEEGRLGARFIGNADTRVASAIDAFLKELHGEALRLKVAEVAIDFLKLEFMNSSCFKAFVSWIGALQDLETSKQYSIVFKSDEKKHWQSRSLEALSCFAIDRVRVET